MPAVAGRLPLPEWLRLELGVYVAADQVAWVGGDLQLHLLQGQIQNRSTIIHSQVIMIIRCARTGSRLALVGSQTVVHSPTVTSSSRRRSMCPPGTRRSCASSTTSKCIVPTAPAANSCTPPGNSNRRILPELPATARVSATNRCSRRTSVRWPGDSRGPRTRISVTSAQWAKTGMNLLLI